MSPWTEFTPENVRNIPEGLLGVFQLSREGGGTIAYVGRADEDLRASLNGMLERGFSQFQWVPLPWVKETFEMHCRLYHHAGGAKKLENLDHPYPPEGKLWNCPVSARSPANCED